MEVKISETRENRLLERKEIEASVYFEGPTPQRKEMKSAICGKIGANPELVVLRSVVNEFGVKRVNVSAHVYENLDVLKKNEPRHIQVREGIIIETKEEKKPAGKKEEKKTK